MWGNDAAVLAWGNDAAVLVWGNDAAVLVTVDHLRKMACDLNGRLSDMKEIDSPSWVTQPVLVDLYVVAMHYERELSEIQI